MAVPTFTLHGEGEPEGDNGSSLHNRIWLFAVPDGSKDDVMLSMEAGKNLYMVRMSPTGDWNGSSFVGFTWTLINLVDEDSEEEISLSDHWHIFAHGFHWISFSGKLADTETRGLWLIRLDTDLTAYSGSTVTPTLVISNTGGGGLVELDLDDTDVDGDEEHSLNDHFMVATLSGVAIFVLNREATLTRYTVVRLDGDGALVDDEPATFGNGSSDRMSNGGAAYLVPGPDGLPRFHVLSPDTLNADEESAITYWRTNQKFDSYYEIFTISESGSNLAMPTQVRARGGYRIVTYRRTHGGYYNDYGEIVRAVFTSSGLSARSDDPEVIRVAFITNAANRPHTSRWGDYLLTCWDEHDIRADEPQTGCRLRVEELSSS